MIRIIDYFLLNWISNPNHKPLLLRGARQVGKTYAARNIGQKFEHFVEINFEREPSVQDIFAKDLSPQRIITELSALKKTPIIPGKTLLFFDEIQQVPIALNVLRYFYEEIPTLHIIAAGSLLDFVIEKIGLPVGRVDSLYMQPLSFLEFLLARGYQTLAHQIITHSVNSPFPEVLHQKAFQLLGEYAATGGMPHVIFQWLSTKDPLLFSATHHSLLQAYRQDFTSYARTKQIEYVNHIFSNTPLQLGRKFKYSSIDGEFRKRELAPALELLCTAGIVQKVHATQASGIPLYAQIKQDDFKLLFLDVGLAQSALGLDQAHWLINPLQEAANKGNIAEAFVGQELACYQRPSQRKELFYWRRESRLSSAEVDYLITQERGIMPIEVKSGPGTSLKSLRHFLNTHPHVHTGIRLSTHNFSTHEKLVSYPLYAVAQLYMKDSVMKEALLWICNAG